MFLLVPAQGFVAHWIQSFKDFPPSQKPASFSIDQVMEKLTGLARRTTRSRAPNVSVSEPRKTPGTSDSEDVRGLRDLGAALPATPDLYYFRPPAPKMAFFLAGIPSALFLLSCLPVDESADLAAARLRILSGAADNNYQGVANRYQELNIMGQTVNTMACLCLSKRGELAVRLIEPPVPEEFQTPEVPPGMLHAVRLLGLSDQI